MCKLGNFLAGIPAGSFYSGGSNHGKAFVSGGMEWAPAEDNEQHPLHCGGPGLTFH